MKKAIRIISVLVMAALALTLCACGEDEGNKFGTKIYGNTDLSNYVTLGKYTGLSVDTTTESFKTVCDSIVESDITKNNIVEIITEGKVKDGDTVNIDYVGKRNGVAFEGGSDQGKDLKIGSNTFIAGFESGLIGAKIGKTVDLHLTFPKDYHSTELAGAAVVFTVKVNYVKSTDAVNMENHYAEVGYASYEEYKASVEKRAVQSLLFEQVLNASEVKDCPDADRDTFIDAVCEYRDSYYTKNYNMSFKTVLEVYNNTTLEDYKKQLAETAKSQLKDQMVYYAILQKEGLEAKYDLADTDKTGQEVLDEITTVEKVVRDYLFDKAVITK